VLAEDVQTIREDLEAMQEHPNAPRPLPSLAALERIAQSLPAGRVGVSVPLEAELVVRRGVEFRRVPVKGQVQLVLTGGGAHLERTREARMASDALLEAFALAWVARMEPRRIVDELQSRNVQGIRYLGGK
jgi:hypothetical protein